MSVCAHKCVMERQGTHVYICHVHISGWMEAKLEMEGYVDRQMWWWDVWIISEVWLKRYFSNLVISVLLFSDIIQPLNASHPPPHAATSTQVLLVELNLHKTLRNKNPNTKKNLSHRFDLNGGESSHQAMESGGDDRCEERLQSGRGGRGQAAALFLLKQQCRTVSQFASPSQRQAQRLVPASYSGGNRKMECSN